MADAHIEVSIDTELAEVANVLARRLNLIETAFHRIVECDDLWIDGNCAGAAWGELKRLIYDKSYLEEIADVFNEEKA